MGNAKAFASLLKKFKRPPGGGLYLQVRDADHKAWLFRYSLLHRAHWMGLGPVISVSLAEARERAKQARQIIIDGGDPLTAKRDHAAALRLEAARAMTFEQCAEAFIGTNSVAWKNSKHKAQWRSTLQTYAYPVLGKLPVQSVDVALVVKVLTPIWLDKHETASRVRGRIERVLSWATAQGLRSGENPASREILTHLLPKISKSKDHHSALPYHELPAFMQELRQKEGVSARALEFCVLTAARTSEVIGAKWEEIDLDEKVWIVPGERMKSKRPHRVPLSDRCVEILTAAKNNQGNPTNFIFVNGGGRELSNMALLEMVRGLRPGMTTHGFRSSFSDWARDRTTYTRDVIEMCLAHIIKDKSEAAYRRGDALDKRRRLMGEWSRYCESTPTTATVTSIHQAVG